MSNRSNEEEQKEEARYYVMFSGCNHTAIKSQSELNNPVKRSMLTNRPVMLCWSCLREEKGACSKSPYHRVASVTAVPTKKRVRKVIVEEGNNNV
jgi:hypothetical protein